jgi:hypothetical protein
MNNYLFIKIKKKDKLWRYQTCVLLSRSPWSANTSEVHDNRSIVFLFLSSGRAYSIVALIDLCVWLVLLLESLVVGD